MSSKCCPKRNITFHLLNSDESVQGIPINKSCANKFYCLFFSFACYIKCITLSKAPTYNSTQFHFDSVIIIDMAEQNWKGSTLATPSAYDTESEERNKPVYLVNGKGWLQVFESQKGCSRTTGHKFKKHTTVSRFKSNNYLKDNNLMSSWKEEPLNRCSRESRLSKHR